ncbi:hypothetical protein SPRG_02480 [Saprolegnia parasitica CBS 223.65]|uniref:WW domain-containing protein n=1 Tax=Saprolegnia parasitica (strain CBS 223.65) TaxID=695850 RepID=A0A067D172_SAPPC|nr:hypothetical protein SPRG_02480 [Saprolegnia parasitica CBS 223.65]KDO32782.1 hypothetical protein SPRG_02480 [Saprolegnia parasitica CBS 223.65]|eukprot:XP_012196445.1 hypothetical protein SPRG_02480 [Saprolegnia parasitica CBS 223.65]
MASNGLHKVLNGPVFRHLNAGLLNAYSDSATLHLAMDSLLCTIESFALLLTDVPLRTSFVKHVLLSSGLLHDCLVPYFLVVLTLHPVSAAAHPTEPTWFQYKDAATGHPYYYNCKTHETRWQLPPGNCVTPARKIQLHVRCLTHWLRLMVALTFQAASIHTTASPLTAPYLHEWLSGLCAAVLEAPTSSATHPVVLFFLENGAAFHYFLSILINVDAFQHAMYNSNNQVARLLALLCAPLDTRTRFHAKCVLASKKGLHVLRDKLSFTLVLGLLQAPEVYFMAHPQALPQPKERWDQYIGNDGHAIYYYNVTTHESVWVLPPPLPPGWIVVWCEDYEQGYFYNSVTRSSSWERPAMTELHSAVRLAAPVDATFEAYSERVMLEWVATAMQFRGRRRSVAPTSIGQHASGHRRPSVVAHNLDYQGLSRFHAPKMLPPVRDKKVFQQENGPKSPPAATIPAKFLCPINRSLMLEPMYSPETELTYEHQAIVHVVQDGAGVCPVTQRSVVTLPRCSTSRFILHVAVGFTQIGAQHKVATRDSRFPDKVEDDAALAP